MSWQAQHFVDLHVQISWQAQHCVNLEVQTCEPPCAESTALVKLEVQISWQAQYKIHFPEIADARHAVFLKKKGGSEAGQSSFAERCVRDGLGPWSDHSRNRPSIVI